MPIRNIPFDGVSPYLPIRIINPSNGKAVRTHGLVDTGASSCAFPGHIAALLGHDLTKGKKQNANSAGGTAESYAHTTTIEIYDFQDNRLFVVNKVTVGYMPKLSVNLLGVENFLAGFQLTVDYPGKRFSIRQGA